MVKSPRKERSIKQTQQKQQNNHANPTAPTEKEHAPYQEEWGISLKYHGRFILRPTNRHENPTDPPWANGDYNRYRRIPNGGSRNQSKFLAMSKLITRLLKGCENRCVPFVDASNNSSEQEATSWLSRGGRVIGVFVLVNMGAFLLEEALARSTE